jgi:hypothetical protein
MGLFRTFIVMKMKGVRSLKRNDKTPRHRHETKKIVPNQTKRERDGIS